MPATIFNNACVLDVIRGVVVPAQRVTVSGGAIQSVEPMPVDVSSAHTSAPDTTTIDLQGKTLMPGLIDAHVHVIAWSANFREIANQSPSYTAHRAAALMNDMLMRGFTTVRDAGGADIGLKRAVEEGYIAGPRLFICGRALTQTGGHSDKRLAGEVSVETMASHVSNGQVVDGVPDVRRACREEIRRGADHIKLMLGGGISSPTDRLTSDQFSIEEIKAAVEEAAMADLYVMAHTYTARAVNRAIECGVRTLEHCNLIDQSSIDLFLKYDAWMVPTLVTYAALAREGVKRGLPKEMEYKIALVVDKGLGALEMAHKAGVRLAFGTDLIGPMQEHQLQEFGIRAKVQPNIDVIRAATIHAAALLGETGISGVVAPGARADLIVVDGNPLDNIAVLMSPDANLKLIMRNGVMVKRQAGTSRADL